MFKLGDIVVYGTDGICSILEETKREFDGKTFEYFVLSPLEKNADVIYVPKNNEKILSKMRHIISKSEAEELVCNMPNEVMDWIDDDRVRSQAFKDILLYGTILDLVSMANLLYLKQIQQLEIGKKLHAQDERFLREAERMVFEEFSYILQLSQSEVIRLLKNKTAEL